jgi:glutathione S-transferase
MKFFNSIGPNPRLVRMFAAEKGIELPETVEVDLMGGENRRAPFTDRNPAGQLPALELDDGTTIAETIAICEYLEELHPAKPMIGATPEERASTRMWTRRVEFKVNNPLADGFRFAEGLPLFKDRIRVIPEAADGLKAAAREGMAWFDAQLAGREFIAGDHLTLADISLFAFLDFGATVGQPVDPGLANLNAWLKRVRSRPSVAASQ